LFWCELSLPVVSQQFRPSTAILGGSGGFAALFEFVVIMRKTQFVVLALVISFTMIMSAEFGQRSRKWTLSEQDQLKGTRV
jgi:hypothetical protein